MPELLAVCLLSLAADAVAGELAPRPNEPYRVVVALGFSDDPLFTRFYKASVVREVHDQLRNYFGDLGDVQVVAEHPLLQKVRVASLADLALTPADYAQEKADNLFLVLVDSQSGVYRLAWRQLNLEVQQAGPLQTRTTADRQWLSKAICLAVREDFAPVAVVEPGARKDTVRLQFHGLGFSLNGKPRLAAWLTEGCVLQPLWVVRDRRGNLTRMPIPYTVIRIGESGDLSTGSVVTNRTDPWKQSARVAGFQAIRLTTCTGRLRLRLANVERPSEPVLSCMAFAHSGQFSTEGKHRLPAPDANGWIFPEEAFAHLAHVTIKHGESSYQVLLPITADPCEYEYRMPLDRLADRKSDWQRRLRYVVQDAQVLQGIVEQRVREVNALNQEKRYEEALKRVKTAVAELASVENAHAAVGALEDESKEFQMSSVSLVRWARQQIDELRARVKSLGELEASLNDTIRQIDARNRAAVLVKLAGEAEAAGEIDDALEKYRVALKEYADMPEVRRHAQDLEAIWTIKSPEHQQARDFVTKTLPAAKVAGLQDALPQAREALAKLRRAGDYLTGKRLIKVLDGCLRELADLVEMLEGRNSDADRRECQKYLKFVEEATQFRGEVRDWVAQCMAQATGAETKSASDPAKPSPADSKPASGKDAGKVNEPQPAAGGAKPSAKPPVPSGADTKPGVAGAKPPDVDGDRTEEPAKK